MNLLRTLICALALAVAVAGPARAAGSTNLTDQWWSASESGWGAAVLQQGLTLFVDLFVYGADGKPTWFVAAVTYQASSSAGHLVFAGDVYAASGPWFGGAFNPALVTGGKVGTMVFDADSVLSATMSYTIGETSVVKRVTRQTWEYENISGAFFGGIVTDRTGCNTPANNGHGETPANFEIVHAPDNTISVKLLIADYTCTIVGNYTQEGHMGHIANGRGPCDDNARGISFDIFEIEKTASGFTARWSAVGDAGGEQCTTAARIGGVRR